MDTPVRSADSVVADSNAHSNLASEALLAMNKQTEKPAAAKTSEASTKAAELKSSCNAAKPEIKPKIASPLIPSLDILKPRDAGDDAESRAIRQMAAEMAHKIFSKADDASAGDSLSARSLNIVNIGDNNFHYFNASVSFKVSDQKPKTDQADQSVVVKVVMDEAQFTDMILAPLLQRSFLNQRDGTNYAVQPVDLNIATKNNEISGKLTIELFCGPDACWRWKK